MHIHRQKKAVVLRLRHPERITTVIPSAVVTPGGFVAVPHRPDETRVLRNLGFDVPPSMPLHYKWPKASGRFDPFHAQIETASFLSLNDRAFVLNQMGSGKTLAALWAYDYLRRCKSVRKVLVVCPLSTMERTWADAVFSTFPTLTCSVLYGSRSRRIKLLSQDADVYVINIDGINTIAEELDKRPDIDLVIVDELAMVRNAQTVRWKTLNKICNGKIPRRVWGMTGSPIPNAPTDAWAQCRLVTPNNKDVPRYFGRFKDNVMRQVGPFKWVPRQDAIETVHRSMQPAIRFALEDCTDLPPQIIINRDVELTPEQQKAYKEMMSKLSTELMGGQVLAVNEAVKLNKLIQIACGAAYNVNSSTSLIPCKPRVDVVRELIEQSEGKVIVFVPLTGALNMLARALASDYISNDERAVQAGKAKLLNEDWLPPEIAVVNGDTSKSDRDQIFWNFQNSEHPKILVANASTMSHGLTLTAATTTVWYAPVHSHEVYDQANARVRRPGQTKSTVIAHIASTDAERRVYKRLKEKQSLQGLLLDLVREGADS